MPLVNPGGGRVGLPTFKATPHGVQASGPPVPPTPTQLAPKPAPGAPVAKAPAPLHPAQFSSPPANIAGAQARLSQLQANTANLVNPAAAPNSPNSPMSSQQVIDLWNKEGGPRSADKFLPGITQAESGMNPHTVQQGVAPGVTGYGLYQITPTSGISQTGQNIPGARAQFGNLLNAANNTKAAIHLYNQAGGGAAGLSQWTDPYAENAAGHPGTP